MGKDFTKWHREKALLEQAGPETLLFHEGEIWWCSIGQNLGGEQDGKNDLFERPVLVFRKFSSRLVWAFPLSSSIKQGPFYYTLEHDSKRSSVLLSQIRVLSAKRFRRLIRMVSGEDMKAIETSFVKLARV